MSQMESLSNQIIIITGGSNGIGKALAELLSIQNYVYILDKEEMSNISLKNVYFKKCDISIEEEVDQVIREIVADKGHIDILVNNAAKQIISSFSNYSAKEYLEVLQTNYIGACNCISAVTKHVECDVSIINVLSIHSSIPRINKYSYDSSKSALEILTKELALEFASRHITVNAISFGAVETNMNIAWKYNNKEREIALSKIPLKKIFLPSEIAIFIKVVLEYFSKYTTGSVFVIDGGRSLTN